MWAIAYPFMQKDEPKLDKEVVTEPSASTSNEERPLHNVKLPKFSEYKDVKEKKHAFFNFIRPHVEAENKKVQQQRAKLLSALEILNKNEMLNKEQGHDINEILTYYGVETTIDIPTLSYALIRVDIIPKELVLMQAANESAWGTSRFARIGLNFFGQWCYSKGCGLVPKRRTTGAAHEVAAFTSVRASVSSYFRNINTHAAYKKLRAIRADLRSKKQPIVATKLTRGLMSYSSRGEAYIKELNRMINQNRAYFNE